jgi:hypothetical protein
MVEEAGVPGVFRGTSVTSFYEFDILVLELFLQCGGPGCLNELGCWITYQLIQAYHQYGVGSKASW